IPAWMHDSAAAVLQQRLEAVVVGLGGDAAGITINSTPRRIAFYLSRLQAREQDRELEVKGPPKKAAYGADGNPTPALSGFLKKNGAAIEDIIDGGDEYVRIKKQIAGRGSEEILQQRIPEIVESIRWPKMMRWGKGEHSYIRPVHSVISVFDRQHVPISIFGVASGTTTVGHRTLSHGTIEIRSYNEYVTKLELARVVVDALRRRHVMAERARILGNEVGGTPSIDASIWSQWQYLTEYPGIVRAEFRRDYLTLPEEVLVMVMRHHQKQLPIRDSAQRLTNYFLAVLDNEADPDGHAAYGNSFVTNARFADAQFFYETDRRKRLEERVESLSHLQFQEKLGSYLDKTQRIEGLAAAICMDAAIEPADAVRAAHLCKADLVTEMVKEFTDLQGKVGGIYAREDGEPAAVWQAVYDHYLPVNADDPLPRNLAGAVVALADKMDTLAGFFSIGAKPTGSKDPFALRRAAQGVVQILLNRDMRQVRIGVDQLVHHAFKVHGDRGADAGKPELLAFFGERVRTLLETSAYGFAYDEIAAAMESSWAGSLSDLVDRIAALKAMRNEANFLSVLDSARRIANITAGHDSMQVDPSRLENEAERRLNTLADTVLEQIAEMIAERHYLGALESFAALAPELESFFQDVMVMVDEPALRSNRMSLLRKVGSAVTRIADVTKIVVDRREYKA
ncbi:MAG: glyS, partial [Acidobacteria bacterium]|nr:glyS [Acidobacteriota bacterium]